jgi:hypothetical protein
MEHDLFGKPVSTFLDHALIDPDARAAPNGDRRRRDFKRHQVFADFQRARICRAGLNLLTRIAKPSLLRIPRTLEQSGWAARRLADGRYRVGTHFDQVARIRDRYDPLAEAAGPMLERLCRTLSWPSDLMVPAVDRMEIRESSRGSQCCANPVCATIVRRAIRNRWIRSFRKFA